MKTITTTAIVLSLALAAGGAIAATPKTDLAPATLKASSESGSNSGCLDFLVFWAVDGQHSPVGNSEKIDDVDTSTGWEATSDEGTVWIDFYDASGTQLSGGVDSGTVPSDASYAYGCVIALGSYPDVPVPLASFTYEDGL